MTNVLPHPSEFSPEVIDVLAELIRPGEHVHDPFAGRGLRLGALCDRLGVTFTATDIQSYPGADPRVALGNSKLPLTYPAKPFTTVTSPPYLNGISSDYKDGPKPSTKLRGRRAYGISAGQALDPENLARTVVRSRPDKGAADYYPAVALAVKHWDLRVIVNVDAPMEADWCDLLGRHFYVIGDVINVNTQRYGGLDNADKRPENEVVIYGWRTAGLAARAAEACRSQ